MRIYRPGQIRPSEITDREVWLKRRQLIKAGVAVGAGLMLGGASGLASAVYSGPGRNPRIVPLKETDYGEDLEPTRYKSITTYNNFYELGYGKRAPAENADALKTRPWSIEVSGECARPGVMDIEDVLKLEQEERLPGQARKVLDWPYREGLRIDEAMHPLAFLETGLYGEVLPGQNGAPLRLVIPWKYGFKSIKSIVSIRVTTHPYQHRAAPKRPFEWRPADCIPDLPWSAGNWRCGNRP
uniref:molybdopterin-dependent oxidoreductase n=1 Tax=Thiolapillus sp. TaxID=2017437 RepID=UPI003AF4FD15